MGKIKLAVFSLENQQIALPISNCERVVQMVEISPISMAPEYVCGTINYHGDFLAVINLRKLFLLKQREFRISDKLIIASTQNTKVAIWVDSMSEIVEREEEEISRTDKILLDVGYIEGLFKLNDGLVLIHDLDKFLTVEEIEKLSIALKKQKLKLEKGQVKKTISKKPVVRKNMKKKTKS